MSSTMPSSASAAPTSLHGFLNAGGTGQKTQGISGSTFLASVAGGIAAFGAQLAVFVLIHQRFTRIYQPRTFLVPERERTKSPPSGPWQWITPVFTTTNADFIQKCGLDAYFFLRYLRTLLKIFIPLAFLILPILLPMNAVHGRGSSFARGPYNFNNTYSNVTGLDQLAWGNVKPQNNHRYWAHFALALVVIGYTCFVLFDELRSYIRLRQAYLTSPQHRLRASATTVLVTAIPTKWCTFEALDGLYDVYPGGIRNIWINRNFDNLSDKVKWRNRLASALESAETNLIRKTKKVHMKKVQAEAKKAGNKLSKSEALKAAEEQGLAMAQTDGISSGDPHQVRHTIDEALEDSSGQSTRDQSPSRDKHLIPIPVIGQGIEAVGHGLDTIGKTVFGGLKKVGRDVDQRLNTTGGFVPPTSETIADREQARQDKTDYVTDRTRSRSISPHPENHRGAHDASKRGHLHLEHRDVSDGSTVRQSTSQDDGVRRQQQRDPAPQGLAIDGAPLDARPDGDGVGTDVLRNPERFGEADDREVSKLKFWKRKSNVPFGIPSPTPHGQEEDEFPLSRPSPMTPGCNPQATINGKGSQNREKHDESISKFRTKSEKHAKDENEEKKYAEATTEYDPNADSPKWKEYIKEKDRETMRLPIFGWHWMPSIPLLGKKVDAINYCRKEVARLNLEIEEDQKEPEKYPLMNSAFIQFNHQVAAHMACQTVSHHTPAQMAPRLVEISPDDVIWDNMSIKWWESYIRIGLVLLAVGGLIVLWAAPVAFTGLLSNINYLESISWLHWLGSIPTWFKAILQGIVPQVLLALLLILLPVILRVLARQQGDHTGMAVELSVQWYYFAFLFVQVFLVVSISSGIGAVLPEIASSPTDIPALLAQNLPKSSNYFFSYMLLQACSVSAGALVQIPNLIVWFILAPILDSTARQKWKRQITLPNVQWGTFFPIYTNLACIGLIYSVISPLMMVFNILTFSLFWLVYRYNTLYVTKFRFDTGGLLYPKAINQLFVGLYFMELVMIGLFFLVRNTKLENGHYIADPNTQPCKIQAIIMIVVLLFTMLYQYLLNSAFGPLIKYLPITLEDEAVTRDEEFARAQEKRWMLEENGQDAENPEDAPQEQGHAFATINQKDNGIEMSNIKARREYNSLDPRNVGQKIGDMVPGKASWADRSRIKAPLAYKSPNPAGYLTSPRQPRYRQQQQERHHHHHHNAPNTSDLEGQRVGMNAVGEALFAGINDEIEDLTPDERDKLVQRAFQHEALRARRPAIWIPRDDLGVSDDEVLRTQKYSNYIWISNEHTGLDGKAKVLYRKSPPDFSEIDLIEL